MAGQLDTVTREMTGIEASRKPGPRGNQALRTRPPYGARSGARIRPAAPRLRSSWNTVTRGSRIGSETRSSGRGARAGDNAADVYLQFVSREHSLRSPTAPIGSVSSCWASCSAGEKRWARPHWAESSDPSKDQTSAISRHSCTSKPSLRFPSAERSHRRSHPSAWSAASVIAVIVVMFIGITSRKRRCDTMKGRIQSALENARQRRTGDTLDARATRREPPQQPPASRCARSNTSLTTRWSARRIECWFRRATGYSAPPALPNARPHPTAAAVPLQQLAGHRHHESGPRCRQVADLAEPGVGHRARAQQQRLPDRSDMRNPNLCQYLGATPPVDINHSWPATCAKTFVVLDRYRQPPLAERYEHRPGVGVARERTSRGALRLYLWHCSRAPDPARPPARYCRPTTR